ncbi:MAG TPA: cellulase family glycosylhydrolase [Bacteroidales bacterium]|nr:cellulase family glycosylhydrolase [Bacteroidales bacterium]
MMKRLIWMGIIGWGLLGFACDDKKEAPDPEPEEKVELQASPLQLSFEAEGGVQEVKITSNGVWQIDFSGSAWARPNISSGQGNALVRITADPNTTTHARSLSLSIKAVGLEALILELQQAAGEEAEEPVADVFQFEPTLEPDQTGMRDLTALELSELMGLGWNLGNSLEAIVASNGVYSGGESSWGNPVTTKALIDGVKAAGFNTLRIPVSWSHKLADRDNMLISLTWLQRVEEVVNYALDNDMFVKINVHWDGGWLDHPLYDQQEALNTRLAAYWQQIAAYFRDYDDRLLFAGTNEVHLEGSYADPSAEHLAVQNSFNQTFVETVRATGGRNAYRHLVVQGFNTNITHTVNGFVLPADEAADKLFVEVHYYDPYEFALKEDQPYDTQWGASFAGGDVSSWGQEAWVEEAFGKMKTSFVDKGVPVIIGEYGALHRTDLQSLGGETYAQHKAAREFYLEYVTRSALEKGLVPVYWDNGHLGNNGFGLFDRSNGEVEDQGAVDALMRAKLVE